MIFYFSATGNSRYVAERIAAATGDDCLPASMPQVCDPIRQPHQESRPIYACQVRAGPNNEPLPKKLGGNLPEGAHRQPSANGERRLGLSTRLRREPAARGVWAYRTWAANDARHRFTCGVWRVLQDGCGVMHAGRGCARMLKRFVDSCIHGRLAIRYNQPV